MLLVCHCYRENDCIRIILARKANKEEAVEKKKQLKVQFS